VLNHGYHIGGSLSALQEIGNSNAQWWSKHLLLALDGSPGAWCQIGLRQLSGMLILVFARSQLKGVLGEVGLTMSSSIGIHEISRTYAPGQLPE
jgi:hypothetical protein